MDAYTHRHQKFWRAMYPALTEVTSAGDVQRSAQVGMKREVPLFSLYFPLNYMKVKF